MDGQISQQQADSLIVAMSRGDMHALETLYNAMYREIYGYLLANVGSPQTAEDLAQDTFLRVWQFAPKFTPSGCGRSWVYKIASRLALSWFRSAKESCAPLSDELPSPHDCEEQAVNARAVANAMARIPEEERQIVSLHAVSGLSLREIAGLLDKPLGTVKWKHAQGLKRLRELLSDDTPV